MSQRELLRLNRIIVEGLFHIYKHHIELNLADRVTLLHGPNGVGKTVVLRMVDALLNENFSFFRTIPFSSFLLGFDDGSTIKFSSNNTQEEGKRMYFLELTRDGKAISGAINSISKAERIASKVDYISPHYSIPNTWIDVRDGEILDSSMLIARYEGRVKGLKSSKEDDISWYRDFLKNAKSHFIGAQRLVFLNIESKSREHFPYFHDSHDSMVLTVMKYSQDFKKRLDDTMANYGRQSQTLDQSFPQRLISATDKLTVDELTRKMYDLDYKTAEYKSMGILDETSTHPFSTAGFENIDSTQARVMTLYVEDTAKKLQSLDDLAKRAHLLLENVNQKFRHKKIKLDRNIGLVAESENGNLLSLDSLSSGEQHELVLHYDLLFKVPSNTIVLIDEPELSLHVAWQKKFLPELLEIVQLSDFDALVATHSPYIISDREDLMVGLGGIS